AWVMAAPSAVARRVLIGLSAVWAWLQPLVAWMVAERAKVARRARTGLSAASALLALVMASLRTGWRRLVPGPPGRTSESGGAARPGAPSGRARLVAAVAAVTFVLALSVSALTPFGRQMFADAASLIKSIGGGGSSAGSNGSAAGGSGNGAPGITGTVGTGHGTPNPGQP